MWIKELNLTMEDKGLIENSLCLNDQVIFAAQKVLQRSFPSIKGWQSTHCNYDNKLFKIIQNGEHYVQILLTRGNHWITVSKVLCDVSENTTLVSVYDSLQGLYLENNLKRNIAYFIHTNFDKMKFNIMQTT